jgi:hypothetical protein
MQFLDTTHLAVIEETSFRSGWFLRSGRPRRIYGSHAMTGLVVEERLSVRLVLKKGEDRHVMTEHRKCLMHHWMLKDGNTAG